MLSTGARPCRCPNGIQVGYDYDVADQLTGIAYQHGGASLGTLTLRVRRRGSAYVQWVDRSRKPRCLQRSLFSLLRRGQSLDRVGADVLSYDAQAEICFQAHRAPIVGTVEISWCRRAMEAVSIHMMRLDVV